MTYLKRRPPPLLPNDRETAAAAALPTTRFAPACEVGAADSSRTSSGRMVEVRVRRTYPGSVSNSAAR